MTVLIDIPLGRKKIARLLFSFLPLLVLALLAETACAQQESMYSQYMFNMLQINPAYAGNRVADNINVLYRHQWVGLEGAPRTASVSWDRRAYESNIGYGLNLYNDRIGIEKTTGLQGFFSYYIPFEDSYLSFGVSGGLLNYQANYSESQTYTGGDPVFQEDANGWLPTAGFGVFYISPRWYVGASIPALLHTKINVQNYLNQNNLGASNHYFLTGGGLFELSENVKFKPSALIKAVKGSSLQFDINANFWIKDVLCVGASYRYNDALVGLVEYQISPRLRLGYSYDYTISNLNGYNRGTHEIMLRIEIPCTDRSGAYLDPN
jgi:type IX secretion system PorP/SprF family membrane protein